MSLPQPNIYIKIKKITLTQSSTKNNVIPKRSLSYQASYLKILNPSSSSDPSEGSDFTEDLADDPGTSVEDDPT